jgi:guanyl-specific ribonuclease Sa
MLHRWMIAFLLICSSWAIVSSDFQNGVATAYGTELDAARSTVSPPATDEHLPSQPENRLGQTAPQKAYDLLEKIQERHGEPLPGYVGGRGFMNREHKLPPGSYREYDVNRKIPGRSRDAERIVIEHKTGKAYYTGDHYHTFVPLN